MDHGVDMMMIKLKNNCTLRVLKEDIQIWRGATILRTGLSSKEATKILRQADIGKNIEDDEDLTISRPSNPDMLNA
jgi:hypothetical protein